MMTKCRLPPKTRRSPRGAFGSAGAQAPCWVGPGAAWPPIGCRSTAALLTYSDKRAGARGSSTLAPFLSGLRFITRHTTGRCAPGPFYTFAHTQHSHVPIPRSPSVIHSARPLLVAVNVSNFTSGGNRSGRKPTRPIHAQDVRKVRREDAYTVSHINRFAGPPQGEWRSS